MEYRPLGRTGVSVSQLCLGAMMFGAFGNSDYDDAIKIIHKALDAGINFIMAVAFATRHPAVTSAIIGPRTMEHIDGYLAADGIELSADVLDRIDEIVSPGVTINVADNMWNVGTPALGPAFRRR